MRQAVLVAFDTPVGCDLAALLCRTLQHAYIECDRPFYPMQCQLAARDSPLICQLDVARMVGHVRIALDIEPLRRAKPLVPARVVAFKRGYCDGHIHPGRCT